MRFIALVILAVALALGLGGWSAHWMLTGASAQPAALAVGPWHADPLAGSIDADPYEKARLARTGDLTLGLGEGVAFRARTDSTGAALRRECNYRLTGQTPLSQVWTLAPFTTDGRLIQPGDGRTGWLVSRILMRADDNGATISVGPQARPGNWLATTGEGPLVLALTFYDTPASSSSGVGRVEAFGIAQDGCDRG